MARGRVIDSGVRDVELNAPAFVGRDGVLGVVTGALARSPAMVLIEGEAGIGKTRLVGEALTGAAGGAVVLVAACPALLEPFPLGAVVDGIRRLRPAVAGLGLSRLGGALRQLFPEWIDDLPPGLETLDDPAEIRHRLLRALSELVERLEVGVLVVEDAHWADSATLEWLLMLTAAVPEHHSRGLSVVVTYRPTDIPAESLLPRLTFRPPAGMARARVRLEPLDVTQTRRLVGSMFGTGQVSEAFAAFLHERTGGVPLAVEESVRLLRDREDIVQRDGAWTRRVLDDLQVPATVRDSVLERVARLDADARAVLQAGAVLAAPADEHQLRTVAGLGDDDGDDDGRDGVTAALAAGLLQETGPGRFVFRHVLAAQAVAEAIPGPQRRRLHTRAVEALRDLIPEPVVRLARHCQEAGDTEAWCRYAEKSADLAWTSGDDRVAARTLLEVLTTLAHPAGRAARLARKLGELSLHGTGAFGIPEGRVEQLLRDVVARDDLAGPDRGEIRLWLGRMLHNVSESRQLANVEIEAAIPDLGHRPDLACRAMIVLAMPVTPHWPAERHLGWLRSATDLSDQIKSALERRWFAVIRTTALLLLGEEAGWEAAAELADSGVTRSEQQVVVLGLLNVGQYAITWGRYDEARTRLHRALEVIETGGVDRLRNNALVASAYLDWYTGAWDGLLDAATALADAEESEQPQKLEARQLVGLLEQAHGARSSAERRLREVTDEHARLGAAEPLTTLAPAALARLYVADGACDKGLHTTEPVVEMIAGKGVWLWATDVAPVHVEALIGAGRRSDAQTWVGRFAAGIDGRDAPAPQAALLVCQALTAEAGGHTGRAAGLFAAAATAWAALPRPYDELLALERRARCLLAAGAQDHALTVLSGVQQRLGDLGARWDADRVAHLLRHHGVEVVRTWRRGPQGYGNQLSPRELEVVALVARGMTNKQVAEALFVSPKTVATQLSAAMRKLGVSSRTAVAVAAVDAGLLAPDTDDSVN